MYHCWFGQRTVDRDGLYPCESQRIHGLRISDGIDFFVQPRSFHDRTKVEFRRDVFSYDETQDVYFCPNGKILRINALHRSASGPYWEYRADREDCSVCPLREKCLSKGTREVRASWRLCISTPAFGGICKDRTSWNTGRR